MASHKFQTFLHTFEPHNTPACCSWVKSNPIIRNIEDSRLCFVIEPYLNIISQGIFADIGEAFLQEAVQGDGRKRGGRMVAILGDTPEPSVETSRGVLESLENLVPNAMGRMIPIVSLLKQMIPAGDAD